MPRSAFRPYLPLQIPKPVCDGVWIVDGPEIALRAVGLAMPFPTRMTILRLSDGRLWLHSPVAPSDALVESISDLGPVASLVAPNSLHYWWIPEWKVRFPDAEVHAVPGLSDRAKRPLRIDHVLDELARTPWGDEIRWLLVRGDGLIEAVFFHVPTRTLVLTDLIENFEPARVRSGPLRLLIKAAGAAHPDGKAPIDMRFGFYRHRRALRRAVETMIAWQPIRVVIAHGRWYDTNGSAELRRAFRWALR